MYVRVYFVDNGKPANVIEHYPLFDSSESIKAIKERYGTALDKVVLLGSKLT